MEAPINLEDQKLCENNNINTDSQPQPTIEKQILCNFRGTPLLLQNIDIVLIYFLFNLLNDFFYFWEKG